MNNKKYFYEKESLETTHATSNPHRPITNKKNNIIGYENHDITLYFEPIDDDMKSAIGTLEIKTGADEITWGYGVNTKRFPTYGGEVVQILSTYADKMAIRGTCLNYKELTDIYEYFKNYLLYTTGGASLLTGGNSTERKQKFLKFTYPARNWSFVIMVADASGFKISRDVAAPQWQLSAEIVSENDRYAMGSQRIDRFANVLSTPVSTGSRGSSGGSDIRKTKRSPEAITSSNDQESEDVVRLPKNFDIERAGDPFGNLMDFANGNRGKIAENFHALVASWATGDVSTMRVNPIVDPYKTEDEIWTERFGSLEIAGGGSVGDGSGIVDPGVPVGNGEAGEGGIVWGEKKRVFATLFGDPSNNDDNGIGYKGDNMQDEENWDSYAELATNETNFANSGNSMANKYDALGGLEYMTPIRVTYKGKSKVVYKRDVGFGSGGPDNNRKTLGDNPAIDLWYKAAHEIGFKSGWDWVDIEIGQVAPGGSEIPVGSAGPINLTGTKRAKAIAYAKWMIDNEPQIHYSQEGTRLSYSKPTLPMYTDCSAAIVLIYQWAGAKNPGASYTGDMQTSLKKINRSDAGPGDIIVYYDHPDRSDHAEMILRKTGNTFVTFSHGEESGPYEVEGRPESRDMPPGKVDFLRWPGVD